MSMEAFIQQMLSNPSLLIAVILTLAVIMVNGWTDAPNAIATCVSTRAIGVRSAIAMAAVFNFLGVFVMTSVNASVAMTIYNMVDQDDLTQAVMSNPATGPAIVNYIKTNKRQVKQILGVG